MPNGDAFLEHDRTATGGTGTVTREIPLDQFPTAEELWARYRQARGLSPEQAAIATQDYHEDASGKTPRYYQLIAINRTVEAIARGERRILLVMATGTGKTYVAFQIIWRLWKSGARKRILFLVDRNILADQTKTNDFKPFGQAMTKITNRTVDKSYEIYLCLYQAVTGTEEERNIYKQFSPDFFDLVIVDECHRGSAAEDAEWRKVLDYFSSATQIGLTATPKETRSISNSDYFGEPIYTYSLRQGISDGFLAPYKVIRIGLDRDLDGWRPEEGQRDKYELGPVPQAHKYELGPVPQALPGSVPQAPNEGPVPRHLPSSPIPPSPRDRATDLLNWELVPVRIQLEPSGYEFLAENPYRCLVLHKLCSPGAIRSDELGLGATSVLHALRHPCACPARFRILQPHTRTAARQIDRRPRAFERY